MEALRTFPWPHLLIDDFLPADLLREALADIQADRHDFEMEARGTGRIEFSLLQSERLWRAVYSRDTIFRLNSAFGVKLSLNKHNMLQLRRMTSETPDFPLHNDFVDGSDTIASFLYISPNWSLGCGGRFNLFESEHQAEPVASIEPKQNRLLAFRTDISHWHAVERVHGWERLSVLALWDVQQS